jgi:hypothetical protein
MATTYRPTTAKLSEYSTSTYEFRDFPLDTPIETLLIPETWMHVAKNFKVGDELLVKPQGLPYRALLIVLDSGANYAKVRLLNVAPLNAQLAVAEEAPVELVEEKPVEGPMFVKWNPGLKKYSVYRKSDGERVHEGFAIKADAEAWAEKHTLAMAA